MARAVKETVPRLATGGPIDPSTGAETAAAGQVQVAVETAVAALDPGSWEIIVAEDRPRLTPGGGADA